LKQADLAGTASNYECSQNSIKNFLASKNLRNLNKLYFRQVNKDWLVQYERFMLNEKERSLTTVGIYLRPLRALFNKAIAERIIDQDSYPFGKGKYMIPAPRKTKKALSALQLQSLFTETNLTEYQRKAIDFWFFSFACNGMNMKDVAHLKWKDISNDTLTFYRAKTINSTRSNLAPVVVYLNDYSKMIIEKYGAMNRGKEDFVFEIITKKMTSHEKRQAIQNFTRFVNQHVKSVARKLGLPTDISTYWARHSFTTNSIRKGATLEFMQESLGHSNLRTTQSYYAGFESDVKKEFAKTIMDF